MRKKSILKFASSLTLLTLILSGCASYRAMPLHSLCLERSPLLTQPHSDIVITARTFDKWACKKYLDRDVIHQGYLPIQLCIENKSDCNYLFSLSRVSIPCARPEEVAETVHTSTVARAAGYGAAALIFWPFAIPAVVDGVRSARANDALDEDFFTKTAKDQTIVSHSYANMLLFVPIDSYQPVFTITLIDLRSNQPRKFAVSALN